MAGPTRGGSPAPQRKLIDLSGGFSHAVCRHRCHGSGFRHEELFKRVLPIMLVMLVCNQLNRSNIGYAPTDLSGSARACTLPRGKTRRRDSPPLRWSLEMEIDCVFKCENCINKTMRYENLYLSGKHLLEIDLLCRRR